ncbi:metallophosphoesterase [Leptospira sp. 'Mane']|uniref:metallophosphoesterase n=1 Tax=Leptospira sp. 'Mane' TaxID=3387407 RepID=UPI00398B7649
MPDIKYVCLSDMHLGAENSLLTKLSLDGLKKDFSAPSQVLISLVDGIRKLISFNQDQTRKPTLILLGDILELALAETQEAGMVFDQFIDLIFPKGDELFEEVFYIPGNHDHHLWEIARESQYIKYIQRKTNKDLLPEMWHTTNIFIEDDPFPTHCDFMTAIVQNKDHLKNRMVKVAYPNFGILSNDTKSAVILHHGHFLEDIYLLMSTMNTTIFPNQKMPEIIWDIEKENFAWIDFFWSAMGRSGNAGRGVELIYDKMTDEKKFSELLKNIATKIVESLKAKEKEEAGSFWKKIILFLVGFIPGRSQIKIVYGILKLTLGFIAKQERSDSEDSMSDEMRNKLVSYLDVTLFKQLIAEKNETAPKEIQFVFGHTHKPFAETFSNSKSYVKPINLVNTGGWVVDTVERKDTCGGAVVLIDENLNIAPVCMYKESSTENEPLPGILPGAISNPFVIRIQELISNNRENFESFSKLADREIELRIVNLKAKINA